MEWLTPQTIAGVGFPMALSIYLIVRFEKAIIKNTETISEFLEYLRNERRVRR